MAMVNQVNQVISPAMAYNPNVKDSRWLTLEVCREYQRSKCSRTENECKFAHPPPHVEVQNGRVTCCFDSIKGKCQRKDPPCKYLHPPQHLKEQLLQNGRNNLIMRNLQIQIAASGVSPLVPTNMYPLMYESGANAKPVHYAGNAAVLQTGQQLPILANPYLVQNPGYSPYGPVPSIGMVPTMDSAGNTSSTVSVTGAPTAAVPTVPGMMPATINQQPKLQRPDRLETSSSSNGSEPNTWTGSHPESITPVSQYSPVYFQNTIGTVPQMVPIKRHAVDNKSGMPVYQPSTGSAAYQQAALAMQLQQQPFAPVTLASHPAGMQRF